MSITDYMSRRKELGLPTSLIFGLLRKQSKDRQSKKIYLYPDIKSSSHIGKFHNFPLHNGHGLLLLITNRYSFVSNKRRVANKRRVWKKYQNLINVVSGTNVGAGIFVRLNKEIAENSHFFRFSPKFSMIFFKNK